MTSNSATYLTTLHQQLDDSFNLEELRTLCLKLNVDYESIAGDEKPSRIRELLLSLGRNGRLPDLIALAQKERPNTTWTAVPDDFQLPKLLASSNTVTSVSQSHIYIYGDMAQGDKIAGDKVSGNKIEIQTYIERQVIVQGFEIVDLEQLPPKPGNPPYKGLNNFTATDHKWFFGRERITAVLVNRLHDQNFLAVVGYSGSGKSSLIQAGVIPVITGDKILSDGTVPPLGEWHVKTITPTTHPLTKLSVSLFPHDRAQQAALQKQAMQSNHALHDCLSTQHKSGHKLLLFVDQFEEVFTLCEKESERQAFVNNLIILAKNGNDIKLIITLRADFYAQCLRYKEMRRVLKTSQEPLGAMSSQELSTAILEPAAKGNWQFQAGLVEKILDDVGEEPGRLPLLSHALLETWQRRRGHTLTLSGYQEAGKVQGAIAQTADATYQELNAEEQKIAQRIFLRLTELGDGTQDTRRRVSQTELGDNTAVKTVTKILADARLITTSKEDIDVSHEALIREWPRLRGWLDAGREGLLIHRRLTIAAKTWEEKGTNASYLYTGRRLEEATQWAEDNNKEINTSEQAFLNASFAAEKQEQRNRRILQIGASIIISVLIMLFIGAFLINGQRNEAVTAQETAVAAKAASDVNAELAIDAQATSDSNAELANAAKATSDINAELAVAAQATSDSNAVLAATSEAEARTAEAELLLLKNAIQASQLALASKPEVERDPELALLLATTGLGINDQADTQTSFYNAIFTPYRRALNGHIDDVNSAIYNPDGNMILTASWDGTAKLWDLQGNELTSFEGHSGGVNSAVFNPDGDIVLTASEDGTAKLWDLQGNELASLEGHTGGVNSATFNPNGDRIITASGDRTAKLWDLQGNELVSFEGHSYEAASRVNSAVFNPDGDKVLTASGDRTAKLWDLQGNELASLEGHSEEVKLAVFNPDGDMILTASNDNTVKLWNLQGNELASLEGHSAQVNSAAFDSDGDRIVTASGDRTAKLWDLQGNELASFEGYSDEVNRTVNSAIFNPNGDRVLTANGDGTTKVWDLQGNELASFEGHSEGVNLAIFNPNGDMILTASNDNTVKLWNLQGNELASLEGYSDAVNWTVNSAIFNPDGNKILTASWNTAKLWDLQGSEIASLEGHSDGINSVVFNADGNKILTASGDGTAKLWDLQGNELASLEGYSDAVTSATFNIDGDRILTASWDGTAKVWDLQGNEIISLDGFTEWINSAVFNVDEDRILTASGEGTVKVWDIQGNEIISFDNYSDWVTSAVFNPDGDMILTASDFGTAKVWDLKGTELASLENASSWINPRDWSILGSGVNSAIFNIDGNMILTAGNDNTAALWDLQGNEIASFEGHILGVNSAVFNPDGNMILTASDDGTAKLWDLRGNEIASFEGHIWGVNSAVFDPAGDMVLTASSDGTAKLWPVYPTLQSKMEVAQERLSRGFTDAECIRFFSDDRNNCPQTVEAVFALFADDLAKP